jgi:tRNA(fMet)-specific endonuclease VapC
MIVEFRNMESTKKSHPIGQDDLQVTAIALANYLISVTHNIQEFERMNGLRIEDWESMI